MPERSWCHGPCKEESPGQCKSDALDIYTDKRCDDDECCSETFTNCADVTFKGVKYELPDPKDNSKPQPPRPVKPVKPGGNSGGGSDSGSGDAGGAGTGVCFAKGGWAGQDHMDK